MSSWHRENPELVGTDADPWMMHSDYRKAVAQQELEDRVLARNPNARADIAYMMENSSHVCSPEFGCGLVQAGGDGRCTDCGLALTEREG